MVALGNVDNGISNVQPRTTTQHLIQGRSFINLLAVVDIHITYVHPVTVSIAEWSVCKSVLLGVLWDCHLKSIVQNICSALEI